MITISNLKKQFGETCACDIPSFTINDGDILGLVGNNGAGKTTLFRLLLDLLKADDGSVLIDDVNPAESEVHIREAGKADLLRCNGRRRHYCSHLGLCRNVVL